MATTDRHPTESLLTNWRDGQTKAERLAASVLGLDGYTDIDPQAPLGGPDGAKDILCQRSKVKCVGAVYFPVAQNSFPAIRKKFKADLDSAIKRKVVFDRFVFITNQRLTPTERKTLKDYAATKGKKTEVMHVERVRALLDLPAGYGIRMEYLNVSVNSAEQLAVFSEANAKYASLEKLIANLAKHVTSQGNEIRDLGATTRRVETMLTGGGTLKMPKALSLMTSAPVTTLVSERLSPDLLCFAHLLTSPEDHDHAGKFRTADIWIGGANSNMQNANFLPPKSEEIVGLVSEMCANWNGAFSTVMGGTQAAKLLAITRLFHQFVFIHPFLDGNGRTGRSLVRQLALDVLKVDCCFPFGEDRQLYVAALMQADAGDFKPLSKMLREHLFPKEQTKP